MFILLAYFAVLSFLRPLIRFAKHALTRRNVAVGKSFGIQLKRNISARFL